MEQLALVNLDTGEIKKKLKQGDMLVSKTNGGKRAWLNRVNIRRLGELVNLEEHGFDSEKLRAEVYSNMRSIKDINDYHKYRLYNYILPHDMHKVGLKFDSLCIKFNELITRVNYNNYINSDTQRPIKKWKDLLDTLGIIKTTNRAKFKRLLITHDLVRLDKVDKVLVFNPTRFRLHSHVNIKSVVAFKDVALGELHDNNVMLLYLDCKIEKKDVLNVLNKTVLE